MRLLAVGAHPDDLEIYAFGAIAAWVEAGAAVTLAVATDGARGGREPGETLAAARRAEAAAAAALLGLDAPRFLDFPDGALVADAALVAALAGLVAEVEPDLVLSHAPNDYHADHRALAAAVDAAAGFRAPVLQADTMTGLGFAPTAWVEVTAQFPLKRAAIRAHASQDPERFVAAAEALAARRAAECNGGPEARAEAFRFAPRSPFADIRALLPPPPPVRPIAPRDRPAPGPEGHSAAVKD
jgi:N-acetylglucosamine malate deacetylase 1